jgi:hypothetical protein
MSRTINYELSYFRPNEESSLDILVNTQGEEIHGVQLVVTIAGTPAITPIDQSSQMEGIQLSVIDSPDLNVIVNTVTPQDDGYQIVFAAITANPQSPFSTTEGVSIAKLIFTQPSEGSVFITENETLTKISSVSTTQGTGARAARTADPGAADAVMPSTEDALAEPASQVLRTTSTGEALETLGGAVFIPPPVKSEQEAQGVIGSLVAKVFPDQQIFSSKAVATSVDIGVFLLVFGSVLFFGWRLWRARRQQQVQVDTPAPVYGLGQQQVSVEVPVVMQGIAKMPGQQVFVEAPVVSQGAVHVPQQEFVGAPVMTQGAVHMSQQQAFVQPPAMSQGVVQVPQQVQIELPPQAVAQPQASQYQPSILGQAATQPLQPQVAAQLQPQAETGSQPAPVLESTQQPAQAGLQNPPSTLR